MDLSGDRTAEAFASNILQNAPQRAILMTNGDEATFALWYFRFALHDRPDVAVISSDLLSEGWYRQGLSDTYPDLVIPVDSFPQDIGIANPGRPVCGVDPSMQPQLDCPG
jgi:hypothetical protein